MCGGVCRGDVLWWLPGQIVVVLSSGDRAMVFMYVRGVCCVCEEVNMREKGIKKRGKRMKIGKREPKIILERKGDICGESVGDVGIKTWHRGMMWPKLYSGGVGAGGVIASTAWRMVPGVCSGKRPVAAM